MTSLHRHLLGEDETSDDPDANFDTNMVIILAALLCALLMALGLNVLMRCVFRYRNRTLGDPETSEREARSMGIKKRGLNEIPMRVYGSGLGIPGTECPICLAEFVDGENVRVLPKCNHGFHVRCIDTWLASHSTCPNCRHLVIEVPATISDIVGRQHCPPNYMT